MNQPIKRYQIVMILSLLLSTSSYSQFSEKTILKLDSISLRTTSDNPDTVIVWAYLDMIDLMYYKNKDTMKYMADKVVEIVNQALLKSNIQQEEEYSLKKALGDAYSNLGFYYSYKGANSKGNEYNFMGLKVREDIADTSGLANSYNNLGSYYNKQGLHEKALAYYRESFVFRSAIGDSLSIALCYNNIAFCFSNMDDLDSAFIYNEKSLEIYRLKNNKTGIARSLTNLGSDYIKIGNNEKALAYYKEGYEIRVKRGRTSGLAYSALNLGTFYFKAKQYALSEKFGTEAYEIAFEIDHILLKSKASHLLSKLYKRKGEYKAGFEMFEQYVTLRDSFKNIAAQKEVIEKEFSYEYEKKSIADSIQNAKQQEIADALLDAEKVKIEQKEQQALFLYLGLGFVSVFGFFAFRSFLNTRKQKRIIESQKHLVEEKNREIIDSIEYAKRIQDAILPSKQTIKELLPNSFILYKPKDIVAGDFYWMEPLIVDQKEEGVLFAAADCTGHGVPGAMVSVICNNGLNRSVREKTLTDPAEILNSCREIVVAEFEKSEAEVKDGMDIAICSLSGHTLKYAGANNPLWIIRKGATEIEEIKADKQPIGKFEFSKKFTTHTVQLNKGDAFYIFSDGYADQFGGEKGKKFKGSNFRKLLLSVQDKSLADQKTIIDQKFEEWCGQLEQIDDVCLIGVRMD